MTTGEVLIFLGLMLIGFVMSALYSGLETGVYVLNPVRLRLRESRGDALALRVRREFARPSRLLAVLLIGTNAANYLGSYGLAELLSRSGLSDGWLIALQIMLFTPLLFVFAETLPKELFRVRADRWMYPLMPLIQITRWVTTVTLLLPVLHATSRAVSRLAGRSERDVATARSRMSQLLKEGVSSGVLSVAQTTLADRVLALRDQQVRTVMVPWRAVWTLGLDDDLLTRTQRVAARHYTRIPVVNSAGAVVGIVSWIDALLHRDRPTPALMRPPLTLTPGMRLIEAMTLLRHEHRAMAIVVDPQQRPIGIVTMKDLVEPLTGELAAW